MIIVTPASAGDGTEDGWGLAALRGEGLVDSIYTSVLTLPKSIQNLVSQNKIAAYMLPLGIFGFIFRSMAGNEPGGLTHVGLNTYCDPREEGYLINDKAKQLGKEVVRLLDIDGKEYLLYNNIPMDMCIIRRTYADEEGNISIQHEAVHAGALAHRFVAVHKSCVDYVVLSNEGEHLQNYGVPYFRPELCGEGKIDTATLPIMTLDVRKVIARRATMEI